MAKLTHDISMSLDGFIAGPNPTLEEPLGKGGEQLHEWVIVTKAWRESHGLSGGETNADSEVIEESVGAAGATVMGRRMFSGGEGPWEDDPNADAWWGDEPPFHHPVFVLTHHAREPVTKQGGTTFTLRHRRHRVCARAGAGGRGRQECRGRRRRERHSSSTSRPGCSTSCRYTSRPCCSAAASGSLTTSAARRSGEVDTGRALTGGDPPPVPRRQAPASATCRARSPAAAARSRAACRAAAGSAAPGAAERRSASREGCRSRSASGAGRRLAGRALVPDSCLRHGVSIQLAGRQIAQRGLVRGRVRVVVEDRHDLVARRIDDHALRHRVAVLGDHRHEIQQAAAHEHRPRLHDLEPAARSPRALAGEHHAGDRDGPHGLEPRGGCR